MRRCLFLCIALVLSTSAGCLWWDSGDRPTLEGLDGPLVLGGDAIIRLEGAHTSVVLVDVRAETENVVDIEPLAFNAKSFRVYGFNIGKTMLTAEDNEGNTYTTFVYVEVPEMSMRAHTFVRETALRASDVL